MISVHLSFNGQCKVAFEFYADLFGGRIVTMMSWADSPMAAQAPAGRGGDILHASLDLDGSTLIGSDSAGTQSPQGFAVLLEPSDPATAERWFAALAEGGSVDMPLQETFWAARFGVLRDRFGIPWEINCGKPH
jgi:PhnB protein